MRNGSVEAGARPAVTPLTALLVSAAVLPGLGQILTGRRVRGVIMAVVLLLWTLVAVVKVGRDLTRILPALTARREAGEVLSFADLQSALAPMAGDAFWLFLPLIAIWVWSLADSLIYLHQSKRG